MSPTFLELGVPAGLADRLARRGITNPFPIQSATLPDALAGRDICGKAPTGSGKTLAFGIPLVLHTKRARPKRPRALVLVPTRELAAQVKDELLAIGGPEGPRVATFYGGVGYGDQLDALRKGVDIAVACPGRLADLVARSRIRLDGVDTVVLDEADRMADMGFLPEVRRLLDQVQPDRQTLLFSATLDGDVDVIVKRYQKDPARHELAVDEDKPNSRQMFWRAERSDRLSLTAKVVGAESPAIVFCRTKRGADRVTKQLNAAGVSAEALHGDRSQSQRDRALAAFSSGRVKALVATDIAARGIHVDGVGCVVHFDPPADEKDYVHRSGRTARAGASGIVLSLVADDQRGDVRKIQAKLGLPTGVDVPDMAVLAGDRPAVQATSAPEARPQQSRPGRSHAQPRQPSHAKPQRDTPRARRPRATDAAPTSGSRRTGRPRPAPAGGPRRTRRSAR